MLLKDRYLEESIGNHLKNNWGKYAAGAGTLGAGAAGLYQMMNGEDAGDTSTPAAAPTAEPATAPDDVFEKLSTNGPTKDNTDFGKVEYPTSKNLAQSNSEMINKLTPQGPGPASVPEAGDFTPEEEANFDKSSNINMINALQNAKAAQAEGHFGGQIADAKDYLSNTDTAKAITQAGETYNQATAKAGELADAAGNKISGAYDKAGNYINDVGDKYNNVKQSFIDQREMVAARDAQEAAAQTARDKADAVAQAQQDQLNTKVQGLRSDERVATDAIENKLRGQGLIQGVIGDNDVAAVRALAQGGDPEAHKLYTQWMETGRGGLAPNDGFRNTKN